MAYEHPIENGTTTGTTALGTAYTRHDITFVNRDAYVYAPTRTTAWTHTSLLFIIHGMTGTRAFAEEPLGLPHLEMALDRGWVVISASNGNLWGNQQVMTDFRNLYEYAARRWWIDHTITYGHSMGGMASLVVGGRAEVPDLAGVGSLNGMIDTQSYRSYTILDAFNASTWEELLVKQAGHDPVRDDPARWADLPVLLITTPSDGSLAQAEGFIDRAVTPETITHVNGSHTHVQNPFIAEVNAWLAGLAPEYVEGQEIGSQPVPKWPGWDGGVEQPTPVPGGAGVFDTSGAEVSLFTTSGTPVSLSAT